MAPLIRKIIKTIPDLDRIEQEWLSAVIMHISRYGNQTALTRFGDDRRTMAAVITNQALLILGISSRHVDLSSSLEVTMFHIAVLNEDYDDR